MKRSGSVSQVSVYDRVKGRVGDVPDETVGAHSPALATSLTAISLAQFHFIAHLL